MYLHLGGDTVVDTKTVLGIFDLDNASWSRHTRDFLHRVQQENRVVNVTDDLPRSMVLCSVEGEERVYISLLSSATLMKRAESGLSGMESAAYNILSGGLMLGAIFMATDYVTSPITARGQLIFGIGCGILTFVIRRFGAYPEGVSYSILLMNVVTPLIDRFTQPKPFGSVKGGAK